MQPVRDSKLGQLAAKLQSHPVVFRQGRPSYRGGNFVRLAFMQTSQTAISLKPPTRQDAHRIPPRFLIELPEDGRIERPRLDLSVFVCGLVTLFAAILPFVRSGFRTEIGYNEGWNVYNAATLAAGHPLYPAGFGWTVVNYPLLSFAVIAKLSKLTHSFLYAGRALSLASLLGCSILVAAVVRSFGVSKRAAALASLFCLAVFCANAESYVGQDDPQIFAQVFYLAALLVYVRRRGQTWVLALAALLTVLGASVKHNLLDIPLAMLLDLALLAKMRAVLFAAFLAGFGLLAIWLHLTFGGPAFFREMLTPRSYHLSKSFAQVGIVLGPILIPFGVAAATALRVLRQPSLRLAALLLGCALGVGGYFGGGEGVSINSLFSTLLAISILLGLSFDRLRAGAVLPTLFLWLLIPMAISGNWNFHAKLRACAAAERQTAQAVHLLQQQPGPALCESLLLCFYAGKPYRYDPFNATRLILAGQLSPTEVVNGLREHRYGAVQLDGSPDRDIVADRFAPEILQAIRSHYAPVKQTEDLWIFTPIAGH